MEHRNSTSLTSSGALRNPNQRQGILGTVAHEFFHTWNMERIRLCSASSRSISRSGHERRPVAR